MESFLIKEEFPDLVLVPIRVEFSGLASLPIKQELCELQCDSSQPVSEIKAEHNELEIPQTKLEIPQTELEIPQIELEIPRTKHPENIVDRLLKTPFGTLEYTEKVRIKSEGRPRPQINSVQDDAGRSRSFRCQWYDKVDWLTGSAVTNCLYCWPCLLFNVSNSFVTWTKSGYNDFKNMDRSVKRHSKSKEHVSAEVKLKLLGQSRVEHVVDEGARIQVAKHNETVRRNRAILKRLIDATTYLGRQELAFRGQDHTADLLNKGNYGELTEVIAHYDELLATHIEQSAVFTGMSEPIQNDLISSISLSVLEEIKKEINAAPFFAWQVDEMTDIGCRSQLSIIVRYVDEIGMPQERFLGLFDSTGVRDGQSVFKLVSTAMSEFDYKEKLVAQAYDGATVMPSELNRLQAKVREVAPSAVFTHCCAHHLNLVLSQGAKFITLARVFFATLEGFSSFFSKSPKRVALLEETGCAATRWNFTSRIVGTVASNYAKLLETFSRVVSSEGMDDDTVGAASGFIRTLEDFDFVFMLFTFNQVFSDTDAAYDIIQQKAMDVTFCKNRIENLLQSTEEKRSEEAFNKIYEEAASLTEDPADRHLRKRHRQESASRDSKQHYRILYHSVLNNLLLQIRHRYASLEETRFLELLNPEKFATMRSTFPDDALGCLNKGYGRFFEMDRLKTELQVFYWDRELHGASSSISDLLQSFKRNGLDRAMHQLYKLMCLVATVGATPCGVDRTFSCLERLKSYARNTMGQERFKNLAVLSIEKGIVKALEKNPCWYDGVIDHFATRRERRADFIYK
ncbi:zinc finger MYM-type protein 1-like [Huso huso]|uniref:Zinc finger MYM-type protein 1-like n=1 Tax=Huso huso TaxID=61971 RepID=A0ABR0YBV1_HUSHU